MFINSNVYDKKHKYYELCNNFINRPIIHYNDI